MSRLKRILAIAALAFTGIIATVAIPQPAEARGYVTFGIGLPGFGFGPGYGYGYAPPPAYYAPPPAYYAPAPAYYAPPVVYGSPYVYGRPYYHPYRRIYWNNGWRRW